jgi:uncharacterized HhH-GPD family protein
VTTRARADRLFFTGDEEADRLLAADPMALLIGFALDQQVTVQKAFFGPLELKRRLGSLDARAIADVDEEQLWEMFRRPPALHRFPGSMAKKVQALAKAIVDDHGGDAARIWTDASDGRDLERRLSALPGFGPMKVRGVIAILDQRFALELPGLDEVRPTTPTLGDVDSPEALADYQAGKRAMKAAARGNTGDR